MFGTGQGRGTALLVTAMGIALVGVAAAVHAKRADIVRGTEDFSAQGNGPKADGSRNKSTEKASVRIAEGRAQASPVRTGGPGRAGKPGSNGKAGDF